MNDKLEDLIYQASMIAWAEQVKKAFEKGEIEHCSVILEDKFGNEVYPIEGEKRGRTHMNIPVAVVSKHLNAVMHEMRKGLKKQIVDVAKEIERLKNNKL